MGTPSMLGGLFTRNRQTAEVPPPPKVVEPPLIPSPQKRLEKERRWLESISSRRGGASGPASSHPPLPAPVEYIKKAEQPPSELQPQSKHGLLDRWSTYHKRGTTAGSTTTSNADTPDAAISSRSLRSTRSTSALATKIGTLKSTIGGRRSRERERQASSSSTISDCPATAAPAYSHSPRTPPLLQLGGGGDDAAAFVYVPHFSPSSALLAPPISSSFASSSNYALSRSATRSQHGSAFSPSPAPTSHSTSSHSQLSTQHRTSTLETTKTLAARLQELEHANNVGLLNDDEYRVLRQNLFQKSVSVDDRVNTSRPSLPPSFVQEAAHPGTRLQSLPPPNMNVQRTGTLLGLPRLNMDESDSRAIPSTEPAVRPAELAPSYLPPPSSTSIHSKTGFSLRSARSNLTTRSTASRMSRLFRKGGSSAPVPSSSSGDLDMSSRVYYEEEEDRPPLPSSSAAKIAANVKNTIADGASGVSIPTSIGTKPSKKGSIPPDWKELQNLHMKEIIREEAKSLSSNKGAAGDRTARASVLGVGWVDDEEEVEPKAESQYRTMRRASMAVGPSLRDETPTRRASILKSDKQTNSSNGLEVPRSETSPSRRMIDKGQDSGYRDVDSPTQHSMYVSAEMDRTASSHSSAIIQPGDESLDSNGLRSAIQALKEENMRLLNQFKDLEGKLHEKYGDPALDAIHAQAQQRRRESISLHLESGRRMSTSSSMFSSQGRHSMIGRGIGNRALDPGASLSMSRRPSKASSIASSSMRRGLNSSGSTHGSTQPGSMETYATSRPPSTVQEELLFTAIEAEMASEGFADSIPSYAKDARYEKEHRDLRERKRNIEERYAARLEYLEARLQGQIIKEKLRR